MQNVKHRNYHIKPSVIYVITLFSFVPMDVFPIAWGCGQGLNNVSTINVYASHNAEEESLVDGGFTFTRTNDLSKPVTVTFLMSGTARNGIDFKQIIGSIHFESGSSEKIVLITPIDDAEVEGKENLTVVISTGFGYILGNHISDTINISDNDTQSDNLQLIESAALKTLGSQPENIVSDIVTLYHSSNRQAEITDAKGNRNNANEILLLASALTTEQKIAKPAKKLIHPDLHHNTLAGSQIPSPPINIEGSKSTVVRSIPALQPIWLILMMACLALSAWRSLLQNRCL